MKLIIDVSYSGYNLSMICEAFPFSFHFIVLSYCSKISFSIPSLSLLTMHLTAIRFSGFIFAQYFVREIIVINPFAISRSSDLV